MIGNWNKIKNTLVVDLEQDRRKPFLEVLDLYMEKVKLQTNNEYDLNLLHKIFIPVMRVAYGKIDDVMDPEEFFKLTLETIKIEKVPTPTLGDHKFEIFEEDDLPQPKPDENLISKQLGEIANTIIFRANRRS